jgi:hypothetical protein
MMRGRIFHWFDRIHAFDYSKQVHSLFGDCIGSSFKRSRQTVSNLVRPVSFVLTAKHVSWGDTRDNKDIILLAKPFDAQSNK